VCVLFLQTVIVIPLAQTLIAVMAQDIVNVRRERQGLSAMSVYKDICGTMAANVSRTSNQTCSFSPLLCFPSLSLLPSLPLFSLFAAAFLAYPGMSSLVCLQHLGTTKKTWTDFRPRLSHTCYGALLVV